MRRFALTTAALAISAAIALALLPAGVSQASHPASPKPLLNCADVNGDGPVTIQDISKVVSKFGTNDPTWTANGTYHPLYDLNPAGGGAITVGDITLVVSDFGLSCAALSPGDTQIAQATLAVLNRPDPPGGAACPGSALLTMNTTCLAEHGYVGALIDVPGQGIHFIKGILWDGIFDPTQPEGLVYNDNRLVAQLYFVNRGIVGGGCWPGGGDCSGNPPPDQVDVDNLSPPCVPQSPGTACSWAGTGDGWHTHTNLCQVQQGTPFVHFAPAEDAAECEAIHNQGKSQGQGGTWTFFAQLGWMSHFWNHQLNKNVNAADVGGNGRYADCLPEPNGGTPPNDHWNGFNCPQ